MPISAEVQQERRRKILAKTREMIMDVGIDDLNVRELADHCGVSVPTLYNQFENKDNLILAAADEIFRSHFGDIKIPSGLDPLDKIFFILDSSTRVIYKNPEFSRLVVRNMQRRSGSLALASNLYLEQIREMQARGEIFDWVNADLIGDLLYRRIRTAAIEWAVGHIKNKDLAPVRRIEICLTLLGISSGEIHDRLLEQFKKESNRL